MDVNTLIPAHQIYEYSVIRSWRQVRLYNNQSPRQQIPNHFKSHSRTNISRRKLYFHKKANSAEYMNTALTWHHNRDYDITAAINSIPPPPAPPSTSPDLTPRPYSPHP